MTAPQLTAYIQGQGSVTADGLNTFAQTCDTVSDLRNFIGVIGNEVFIRGTVAVGDGGAGAFYWNPTSLGPDDGATVIVPVGAAIGAWIRLPTSGNVVSVPNIATLRATDYSAFGVVYVEGYYTAGDGGQGMFVWDATSGIPDNGGTIIQQSLTTGNGRWFRGIHQGPFHSAWFGILGDGTTDNAVPLQTLMNAANTQGNNSIYIDQTPGQINFGSTMVMPFGINIRGDGIDNSKLTYTGVAPAYAFIMQAPIGLQEFEGPNCRDFTLTCNNGGNGFQINSIGGGFTDDANSQGAISHVFFENVRVNGIDTPGTICMQFCKTQETTVQNCRTFLWGTHVDAQGAENFMLLHNWHEVPVETCVRMTSHGTFGNEGYIAFCNFGGGQPGLSNFIDCGYRSATIFSNFFENIGAGNTVILLDNGFTATVRENNISVLEGTYTNWLTVVGDSWLQISVHDNRCVGLLHLNANFNSNTGLPYFAQGLGGAFAKVTHSGNFNLTGDNAFPMNTVSDSNSGIQFMPKTVSYYSPNVDGLLNQDYGTVVRCNGGAFALPVTGVGNSLHFGQTFRPPPIGTFDLWVLAYSSAPGGVLAGAVTNSGAPTSAFGTVALNGTPMWFKPVSGQVVGAAGGAQIYNNTPGNTIYVFAVALVLP